MTGKTRGTALALVLAGTIAVVFGLGWGATQPSQISLLPHHSPAAWIIYPAAPDLVLRPRVQMSSVFKRSLTINRAPARATLSVAAFHEYSLSINGSRPGVPEQRGRTWKEPDAFEVSRNLHAGENEIAVTVSNSNGPPALWLRLETDAGELITDEHWQASYAGGAWGEAQRATTRRFVPAGSPIDGGETASDSLRSDWPLLLVFAALSAGAYVCCAGRSRKATKAQTPGSPLPQDPAQEPRRKRTPHPNPLPSSAFAALRRDKEGRGRNLWQFGWFRDAMRVHGTGESLQRLGLSLRRAFTPLVLLGVAWLALFINNLGVLQPAVGFDVDGHLAYVQYIVEHNSLPRAAEGWEMFQPPLYYVLAAALLKLLHCSASHAAGTAALRLMGLATGLVHLGLVWWGLRLIFPEDRFKRFWGLALAGCLPPTLYLSQYVTNEALAAMLASGSVCLTLFVLKREQPSLKHFAGLGLLLGAALLTKSTALLLLPIVIGALLWRGWVPTEASAPSAGIAATRRELSTKAAPARTSRVGWWTRRAALVVVICAALCGWHYFRLWREYGTPLVGNWDPQTGFDWWQDDGYRTAAFYLRFGEALRLPWFSSIHSFADGIYTTLWGDGLLGGGGDFAYRPPWNYNLMALGYWLALVPTLVVGLGGILALAAWVRRPGPEGLLLMGLPLLLGLAIIYMSLAVPSYAQVKAFYGLSGLIPFCVFAGLGVEFLARRGKFLSVILSVTLGTWALNSLASFWIPHSSGTTILARARQCFRDGNLPQAVRLLEHRLEVTPEDHEARLVLASILLAQTKPADAENQARAVLSQQPDNAKAHLILSQALSQIPQLDEAIAQAQQAVRLGPGDGQAYQHLAAMLLKQSRFEQVGRISAAGLSVAPFNTDLHLALGTALLAESRRSEAEEQFRIALGLEPNSARVHYEIAVAFQTLRDPAHAAMHYTEAIRLDPNRSDALNNLAWIRAANANAGLRDGAEAVRLAERACQLTDYKQPLLVGTLAAGYAEAGRFEEALATAERARQTALAQGQKQLAESDQELIRLFKSRQAFHETAY